MKSQYNSQSLINYKFDKILENNGISYTIENYKFKKQEICPIEYIPFNETVVAKLSCGHCFSLNSFVKSLCHSSCCPICMQSLIYKNITILGNSKNINLCLFGKIYSLINFEYYNVFIVSETDNMQYMNKRILLLSLDRNIKFFTMDTLAYHNIFNRDLLIHIDEKFFYSNCKFSLLNIINRLSNENKSLYLNLIN